jgi:hypothetical protein
MIGAKTYYFDTVDGAAAGTRYKTEIYRILHDTICYEANLTVGLSNIENYADPTVVSIDETTVLDNLKIVLDSLRFK